MRLTNKRVAAEALKELPNVENLELHRAPEGYYYVTGEFKDGTPFVSSGIYVFRLHQLSLSSWVWSIEERVKEQA